jgi:LysR family hydrogen peroxide-inducible transcriptional activator
MTLSELKYIVALAQERHFGRAAERCFVSQPTLSVAIKKLEGELGISLFERSKNAVSVTPLGEQVVHQAQVVLENVRALKDIATGGKDHFYHWPLFISPFDSSSATARTRNAIVY